MNHPPKPEDDAVRPAPRPSSRRRFLKLIAAGSAAAATAAVPTARAATRKRAHAPAQPMPAKIAKEIDNQKAYVSKTLDVIRLYPLPPGTEPAFVFQPLDSPRRPKSGDGGSSR